MQQYTNCWERCFLCGPCRGVSDGQIDRRTDMISINVFLVYTSCKECNREGVVFQLGVWAGGTTTPYLNNKSSTSRNVTQGL
jgi:hypothetical protein